MKGRINTYTGVDFYVFEPKIEDIKKEDIAHALSLICRANGHFKHFYSIAQHCINCYKEGKMRKLSNKVLLALLLPDASEAYISDITRPVKERLLEYLKIENEIQEMIYNKFGIYDLTGEEKAQIKEIDDLMLWYEFKNLHTYSLSGTPPKKYAELDFSFKDMKEVEQEYLNILNGILADFK